MDLERKVSKSIDALREFARKYNGVWISFSGGKDSTTTLLLALEALPRSMIRGIVFIEVTGNTHELNIHYVYEVCEKLGVSDMLIHLRRDDIEFFECIERWGIPTRHYRWCFNEFKVTMFNVIKPPIFIAGVKNKDSKTRMLWDWTKPQRISGRIVFSPIADWNDEDVINYVRSRNMSLCPCYELYGHSGNCMFCPMHTKDKIMKTASDPYWGLKILRALKKCRGRWCSEYVRKWSRFVGSKSLLRWLNGGE